MKNVLVTGADGFIGRHLVAELLQNNIKVYALVYIKNHCYINNNDDNLIIIEKSKILLIKFFLQPQII